MAFIILKFDIKLPHATGPLLKPCAHGRIRRAEPTREANCWVVVYFVLELCPQTNRSNLGCQLSPKHVTAER